MTKVAIITRTKNRPLFLERALRSVGSQDFSDYTHVIVNDGGDKNIVESLVNSLEKDQRTKTLLFHRESSSNAPDTIFNESIDRVESEYVAIHDDDDTWHSQFLSKTVQLLEEGPFEGVVVKTDKVIEKQANDKITQLKIEPYQPDVKVVNLYRQCIDNQLTPISFVYSRKAYERVGKYDTKLPVVADWEFGIRFLMRYDVEFLDPGFALANYHHRKSTPGQVDNSFATHDHAYYFNKVANKYLRLDIESGQFGVGYIINNIKYNQSFVANAVKRILPSRVVESLKNKIRS